MALILASYPDRMDPTTPIENAYAWVFSININLGLGTYSVMVWIHRNVGAASVQPPPPPIDRVVINSGDILIPAVEAVEAVEANPEADPPIEAVEAVEGVPGVFAPSLIEVFTQAEIAKAQNPELSIWDALRTVLYDIASKYHKFTPNTVV